MLNSSKFVFKGQFISLQSKCLLHTTFQLGQTEASVASAASNIRPFEEIPSPPKSWIPYFGHGPYLVMKPAGVEQMWINIRDLKAKYVPPGTELLRLHLPVVNRVGGGRVLHLFDPDDIKEIYRNEGKYPLRIDFSFFRVLRARRPDIFGKTSGLFLADGEDWQGLRSKVQQDMMRPQSALFYTDKLQVVGEEFANYIRRNRNPDTKVVDSFIPFTQLYALEAITLITLDTRLGCFDEIQTPELKKVIEANDMLVSNFTKFMTSFPVWDYLPPRWSKMYRNIEDSFGVAIDFVSSKVEEAAKKCEQNKSLDLENASVLEKLIMKNGSKSGIPSVMALDAMLAGIDTTGSTMAILLYLLAKNPEKQEILRKEIQSFNRRTLTVQDVTKMRYFRACQQESFRLMPTTNGNLRVLPHDITLRGYNVPAGTMVLWNSMLMSKDESLYQDPELFKPERWIEQKDEIHPFANRPFGHGPRMCIGKRFAELEIQLAIFKLLQNFKIEWAAEYDEIELHTKMINSPSKNLKFKFVDL